MASKPRSVLAPGTRFGRYEVVADIASGGMAMVYLARALGAAGFQRLVAIKLMHAQYAHDEDFVGMFMDEARLAARIRHPNVVATLDLENDDDGLYLVMEYIEGDTLLSLLRAASKSGKRIPPPITLRIVLDMLNGLHAAHELTGDQGEPLRLVHRDVSPHNVLVSVDGISRITDFGIARAEERVSSTRDGQVKGKIAYMAPEQTSGTAVDRRVDLFATGIVLWECLAGKRLFAGDSDGEVLRRLLVNPIPKLREVVPDVSEALEQVCAKALERDPDARFASAAQMADAVEHAGGSIGIASSRAVSQFVREISGDKITAMQERVRGTANADSTGTLSAVRPVRRRDNTDPERTLQRHESDMQISPGTGSKKIPMPVVPPTIDDLSADLDEPVHAKRGPVAMIVGAFVAVLLVGIGGYAVFGRHPSQQTPPLGRAGESHPTVAAATVAPLPAVDAQATPPTPPPAPPTLAEAAAPLVPETPVVPVPAPAEPSEPTSARPSRPTQSHRTTTTTTTTPAHGHGSAPAGGHPGTFNPESM